MRGGRRANRCCLVWCTARENIRERSGESVGLRNCSYHSRRVGLRGLLVVSGGSKVELVDREAVLKAPVVKKCDWAIELQLQRPRVTSCSAPKRIEIGCSSKWRGIPGAGVWSLFGSRGLGFVVPFLRTTGRRQPRFRRYLAACGASGFSTPDLRQSCTTYRAGIGTRPGRGGSAWVASSLRVRT